MDPIDLELCNAPAEPGSRSSKRYASDGLPGESWAALFSVIYLVGNQRLVLSFVPTAGSFGSRAAGCCVQG